jgi:hypothetical protein
MRSFSKYYEDDQITEDGWAGHVAIMEESSAEKILVGKSERNRPLGRP